MYQRFFRPAQPVFRFWLLALLPAAAAEKLAEPKPAAFSNGGEAAVKIIRPAAGMKAALFAEEPMLGNPVSLSFDDRGRLFVAETHRYKTSVWDSRGKSTDILEADLACRTVEDRLALNFKVHGEKAKELGIETESVRLLEDKDSDGKADSSTVYAQGFNSIVDGAAGGILSWGDAIYLANIPNLWKLTETSREALLTGFGVHYNYTGHDFHGPVMGPDGMLYMSIGDRGLNVKTKEGKQVEMQDEGGVYRCWPDGSGFELVHRGMRNPHDLAFDKFGNLFTGDNDADKGDEERVIHVVEGGDSGWRIGYQWPPLGNKRDPWLAEDIFVNHDFRQAQYVGKKAEKKGEIDRRVRSAAYLPHVGNCGDGPAGMAYNPGVTGLPAEFDDHFLLVHFKATAANSAIYAWSAEAEGATFRFGNPRPFVENNPSTDVTFGPDGRVYFCDFPNGYSREGRGRVYSVASEEKVASPAVKEVQTLLAKGFRDATAAELKQFLAHGDMRVRQRAQFALAERGAEVAGPVLATVWQENTSQLAGLHAIWCAGQLARKTPDFAVRLLPLLESQDMETRAQAVKTLGALRFQPAEQALIARLADGSPRVRMFAGIALGRLASRAAGNAVAALLKENQDKDAYVRHGGVMALVGAGDKVKLLELAQDEHVSVRLAALLAMRHLQWPEVAQFLSDKEPMLVLEAARAIHDGPVDAAMPALAAVQQAALPENLAPFFWQRVVNANFRLGTPEAAKSLISLLKAKSADNQSLVDAAEVLADWANPPARDRIIGNYRPVANSAARDVSALLAALVTEAPELLKNSSPAVQAALATTYGKLKLPGSAACLTLLAKDDTAEESSRVAAISALAAQKLPGMASLAADLRSHASKSIRKETIGLLLSSDVSAETASLLVNSYKEASIEERQTILAALGKIPGKEAEGLLEKQMEFLLAGKLAPELGLDVLMAASTADSSALKALVEKYKTTLDATDPLSPHVLTLHGGNAERGGKILSERAELSCLQCHRVKGQGSDVGPDLSSIGKQVDRRYLLESLVVPGAKIAKGFDLIVIEKTNQETVAGIVMSETKDALTLKSLTKEITVVKTDEIKTRSAPMSGMPPGLHAMLTPVQLRDLIEFLVKLKGK